MNLAVLNLPDRSGRNITKDLLNGAWCRGARIGGTRMPPLSLLYAFSSARPFSARASFVDAAYERLTRASMAARLRGADLLVAHTSSYTLDDDRLTLRELRADLPNARFAVFGNLTAMEANELIAIGAAEFVCPQEPEETLAELARRLSAEPSRAPGRIAGLHSAEDLSPAHRLLADLDSKPVPDRTPILGRWYPNPLARSRRWTTALTSRGCLFACDFCNTPGFFQRTFRRHSVDYVLEELRALRRLGFHEVFFRDDLFFAGEVPRLCEAMLSTGVRLAWSCNHRVDTLDEPTLALMARAGCHTIKFGVESGDAEVLRRIGKPPPDVAVATFRACERQGIRAHAHLMIGLPSETRAQMQRTLDLLRHLAPYSFSLGLFTPYPGSPVFSRLAAEGRLPSGAWKERLRGNPSAVCDDELRAVLRRAYLHHYLHPRRVLRYAADPGQWPALARAGLGVARELVCSRRA